LSTTSKHYEAIQTLGDCLSDIVTALQIGEDGQPLEFVSWKAGSAICSVISATLSSPRYAGGRAGTNSSMNISSFSPINKGTICSPSLLDFPLPSFSLFCAS
jgi:hypothetical protein